MADLRWYKIQESVPEGDFIKEVIVAGKKLCLVRHQERIHLLQNSCPHAGAILSSGWCEKGLLICPVHRYGYNLENGRGAQGQGDYIEVYPLKQEPDGLYAGIKQVFFKRFFG
jgi:3-phenylpropionate/trans-cinnamate dioxygenase ferredoxin subunit